MIDAEGIYNGEPCPRCGSTGTVTYQYREGFSELECPSCGFSSEAEELADLQRYDGDLLEVDRDVPPLPLRPIEA